MVCGREITKYTVIYGVCKRFWPTLFLCLFCLLDRTSVHAVLHLNQVYIIVYIVFASKSVGFIGRGCGLTGPSARIPRAALLSLLADLACYVVAGSE
jgi:hypothetical protein